MSDVVLVDATTLIALGSAGQIELLDEVTGELKVPSLVREEVTSDPARTNLEEFLNEEMVWEEVNPMGLTEVVQEQLGEDSITADVQLLTAAHLFLALDYSVAVASDDRRIRNVAKGLGATVTGTVGVVVRAVHEGMSPETAKDLIREVDSHGLHMTGELREKAFELVDDAATD